MADSTGLGFWGTVWQGLEGATGKTAEVAAKDAAQLGYWGMLWKNRGDGFDGKVAEAVSALNPQREMIVRVGRMMGR